MKAGVLFSIAGFLLGKVDNDIFVIKLLRAEILC